MNILERALLARTAGRVTRYHTTRLLEREDVAQHTFGIMNLITIMSSGAPSAKLLLHALKHDMGEYATGDLPSPLKRALGAAAKEAFGVMEDLAAMDIHPEGGQELTPWEQLLFKVADNLDGLLKCTEEKWLGNYSIKKVGDNYASYLNLQLEALGGGSAADLVRTAISQWHWTHEGIQK